MEALPKKDNSMTTNSKITNSNAEPPQPPRMTTTVGVVLPEALAQRLKAEAERTLRPRSFVCRRALEEYLKKRGR